MVSNVVRLTLCTALAPLVALAALAGATEAELRLASPQAAEIAGRVLPGELGDAGPRVVAPGDVVEWAAWVRVPPRAEGLALVSLDIVQDASNPAPTLLPPGDGAPAGMEAFDRPLGVTNPGATLEVSGYGGTPKTDGNGLPALIQVGGAQNTFGGVPPCLGPQETICMAQQPAPTPGVAASRTGQVVATGRFEAPAAAGRYTYRIAEARIQVLESRGVAGEPVRVSRVDAPLAAAWFAIEVAEAGPSVAPPREGPVAPAPTSASLAGDEAGSPDAQPEGGA